MNESRIGNLNQTMEISFDASNNVSGLGSAFFQANINQTTIGGMMTQNSIDDYLEFNKL